MTAALALPVLPVVLPFVFAALLAGAWRWLPRTAVDLLAIAAAAINLWVCAMLLHRSFAHSIVYWLGNWHPVGSLVIGIDLMIDPAAAGCATLASLLSLAALAFSWRRMHSGSHHYQPLMLILLASMCGLSLTGDVFNLFVFLELMSTAAFALCGLETREPAPLQGAFNFAVTNTVAAFMVLTGIAMLSSLTGALNMAQIGRALGSTHTPTVLFAAALITSGLLVKIAIVPFHLWLADAHSVAPTPVCVLFSGIMVELGLYALLRIDSVLFGGVYAAGPHGSRLVLLILGLTSCVLGGVMAYAEHHLKRMLAFSTISHAGLMLLLLAAGTPLAAAAMLLYLLVHALIKASLFFCCGIVLHRFRTISEPKLFAQGRCLRWTAALWFAGAIALAAAPSFAILSAGLWHPGASAPLWLRSLPWVFAAGGILTGAAALRAGVRIFFGWGDAAIVDTAARVDEMPETSDDDRIIAWHHFLPGLVCLLAAVAVLVLPAIGRDMLLAGTRLVDGPAYIATTYTGHTAPLTVAAPVRATMPALLLHLLVILSATALLAATSVFRLRLPRRLRIGAFLEGPLRPLRALQSGHPGDYVMWLTVGTAAVALTFMLLR